MERLGEAPELHLPDHILSLDNLGPGLLAAFRLLCNEGATELALTETIHQATGESDVGQFHTYLQQFIKLGLINYSLFMDDVIFATFVPNDPNTQPSGSKISLDTPHILSRFAYMHQVDGNLMLESPLAPAHLTLNHWMGAAIVAKAVKPFTGFDLIKAFPALTEDVTSLFLGMLVDIKAISLAETNGAELDDQQQALAHWEFHDLLFHTRSRAGRHAYSYGATLVLSDKFKPLPAIKPEPTSNLIDLCQPDLDQLEINDQSFTAILERRQSIRAYAETAVTIEQLGEFLFRVARTKGVETKGQDEHSWRPYPSGGARHSLELYPLINNCDGVSAGLYYYAPFSHKLCPISDHNNLTDRLFDAAQRAAGLSRWPPILILISARFQRVSWKYQSVAYALILKEVGALYQTMYLVATAMGLAPCAVGGGNSDLFAEAISTNYYLETSVGEFILGNKAV